jgi:hypothetical protein
MIDLNKISQRYVDDFIITDTYDCPVCKEETTHSLKEV